MKMKPVWNRKETHGTKKRYIVECKAMMAASRRRRSDGDEYDDDDGAMVEMRTRYRSARTVGCPTLILSFIRRRGRRCRVTRDAKRGRPV